MNSFYYFYQNIVHSYEKINFYHIGIFLSVGCSPTVTYEFRKEDYDLKQGNNKQEVMVWKGQSTIYNPSSISTGAYNFAKKSVNYMIKNKLIK